MAADLDNDSWKSSDIPHGPYYHGSRYSISVGAELTPSDCPGGLSGLRQLVWASTDPREALMFGWQRGRGVGLEIYVYTVELVGVEVDVNWHGASRRPGVKVTSVMARSGRVVALAGMVRDDTGSAQREIGELDDLEVLWEGLVRAGVQHESAASS